MRLLVFNLVTDADDPILGFTARWVSALARRVQRVEVITMWRGRVDLPDNVRVRSAGREREFSRPRRVWEFYRHLHAVLAEGVDACFSHMMPWFSAMGAPLIRRHGIPMVTWYAHPSLTPVLKLAHRYSDRMVTSLPSAYPYRRDKLVVIGQGIDTELFSPDGPPEAPPLVLCAGRLSPVKDHTTLIRAAGLLRDRGVGPFRVAIVGRPAGNEGEAYLHSLRRLVDDLGTAELVGFEPAVPQEHMPAWYRRATVHVNLTPAGFGDKVAWEAMSCGRPSIVANDGLRETLGGHAGGLFFEHGNPESLAAVLARNLSRPQVERDAIGRDLRSRVVASHSVERLGETVIELLTDLRRNVS